MSPRRLTGFLTLRRHFAALLRTLAAQLRALLAMRILKFSAVGRASFAYGRTQLAQLLGGLAAAGHHLRRQRAQLRAILQHADAHRAGLHVRFFQTSRPTGFASLHTFEAGVEAGLPLLDGGIHNGWHIRQFLLRM